MKEVSENKETNVLTFVSLRQSQFLKIPKLTDEVLNFLAVFNHTLLEQETVIRIEPMQQHTVELNKRFMDFLDVYGPEFPQFNFFRSFFRELPQGHYFMIVHGKLNDTAKIMTAFTFLTNFHIDKGIPQPVDIKYFDIRGALSYYNQGIFGHQRGIIGNNVTKEKRICRFCQEINGNMNRFGYRVSFKHKSHSISAALGNNKVVTGDECDGCNDRFSVSIEPSLVTFLSVSRSIYGLTGRGGTKKIVGENFELDPIHGFNIQYAETHDELIKKEELSTTLNLKEKFVPQDIYRCLVKFVLSVVDSQVLDEFSNTLAWVNGEKDAEALPNIAIHQGANFFKEEPMLLCYFRKDDSELPKLVGEFHYADYVFVFIIPFSSVDKKDFCDQVTFKDFWNIFSLTRSKLHWDFKSFDSLEQISMTINFNLKGLKIGENAFLEEI